MKTYVVSYDLRKPGQNYQSIIDKLKGYAGWCRLQQSVWIIQTTQSAVQVRDHLQPSLDVNDSLYVGKLSGEAAWFGQSEAVSKWIKQAA